MKHILLLATGGTIASRPTGAGALAPALTSDELLACVPELAGICQKSSFGRPADHRRAGELLHRAPGL